MGASLGVCLHYTGRRVEQIGLKKKSEGVLYTLAYAAIAPYRLASAVWNGGPPLSKLCPPRQQATRTLPLDDQNTCPRPRRSNKTTGEGGMVIEGGGGVLHLLLTLRGFNICLASLSR